MTQAPFRSFYHQHQLFSALFTLISNFLSASLIDQWIFLAWSIVCETLVNATSFQIIPIFRPILQSSP